MFQSGVPNLGFDTDFVFDYSRLPDARYHKITASNPDQCLGLHSLLYKFLIVHQSPELADLDDNHATLPREDLHPKN